jgi:Sec-independent protein translocase protein TatA
MLGNLGAMEMLVLGAIITFLFGGSKAFQSIKKFRNDVDDVKKDITGIKDDIKSEIKPDILKIRELD